MVRKFKYHEQKCVPLPILHLLPKFLFRLLQHQLTPPRLLKKVDFITYPSDSNHRAAKVIRRYVIQKPDDYGKYNRICGKLRHMAHRLSMLEPDDPTRKKYEDLLLEKLWEVGVLGTGQFF